MKKAIVLGIFDDYESFARSLRSVKARGVESLATYTPVPCHEVDEVLGEQRSPIRHFTLAGGLLGFFAGAALTVYCSTSWPLIVGGKPIISVPPYLIIAFELTILFAAILSTIGYFLFSPLPRSGVERVYDSSFSEDSFGLVVESDTIDVAELKTIMESNGARETRV